MFVIFGPDHCCLMLKPNKTMLRNAMKPKAIFLLPTLEMKIKQVDHSPFTFTSPISFLATLVALTSPPLTQSFEIA